MAKQWTKTMEEQLEEMKAQLAKNQKELKAKKYELAKAKLCAEQPAMKLIPRSKGQAEKGKNGYVLWDAMQLTDHGARYQRLLRLVRAFANAYLPTGKTITNQEKTHIDKLIQLVQKEVTYFQLFQGGWPILTILKQYLQNTTDKFNRDLRVEKAAEAQGPPAPSRRPRTHSEQPEQSDQEDEDDEAELDTDNVDMDVDDAASNQEEEDSFSQYDVDFPELADDSQMEEDLRLEAASWDSNEIVEEPQAIPATAKQRKQVEKENAPPSLLQTNQSSVPRKSKLFNRRDSSPFKACSTTATTLTAFQGPIDGPDLYYFLSTWVYGWSMSIDPG
ncbi:hypothetical protein B0H14DRAFT_3151182 [Mycena olivaceomarginata]|nr:hypothetical protein B0H14DRAFT_3151182 [Mycena olivaceomarginata]